ncbi:MAG TPA: ABC transporter ATP-binding protein [Paenibacillaceae bacterium]
MFLFGRKVSAAETSLWRDVGYLVEAPCAYPELTVRENLEIMRRLRGIANRTRVDRILRQLRLESHASRKARHLSLGNMQRLGIAKALIHKPKLLILDEPANGLDPEGAVEFRELLHDLAVNQGVTILLSSHRLDEIAKIASNIAVMHKGRLVRFLDRRGLERERKKTLLLSGRDIAAMADVLSKAGFEAGVKKNGGDAEPPVLCIEHGGAVEHPERIVTLLVRAGCPPNLLKVEEEDLETFFMRVIREAGGKEP